MKTLRTPLLQLTRQHDSEAGAAAVKTAVIADRGRPASKTCAGVTQPTEINPDAVNQHAACARHAKSAVNDSDDHQWTAARRIHR